MLIFRLICAVMVAWAINWVLSRPEAALLVGEIPEMVWAGPLAGAVVGFFNLAKRQGWGLIVAVANGVWTGILSISFAGFIYLSYKMVGMVAYGLVQDFKDFMRILNQQAGPLIDVSVDPRLIVITIGATAVAGVISECLHWSLVRLRRHREDDGVETV
jgi:hypothetical protein